MGCLEILNVQGGEVKISFDTKDAPEAIRARRVISEMIRSGFVLLVEVERNKEKRFERALSFDEAKGEYIVADFVPTNGSAINGAAPASGNGAYTDAPADPPAEEAAAPTPQQLGLPQEGR